MANSAQKKLLVRLARPGKPPIAVEGRDGLTLGTDYAASLTVDDAFIPPSYAFIKESGKHLYIRLHPKMDGAITLGEEKSSIGTLMRMGVLPRDKDFYLLEVHPDISVEVRLPSGAILTIAYAVVQAVAPSKLQTHQEKIHLHSLPGREKFFITILVVSLLIHAAFGLFLQTVDIKKKDSLDELKALPPRFAKLVLTPKKKELRPETPQKPIEEAKKEEEPKKEEEKKEAPKEEKPVKEKISSEKKMIREKVEKTGVLGVIASRGGVLSEHSNENLWRDVDSLIKGSKTISEAGDPLAGLEGSHAGVSAEELAAGLKDKSKKSADDLLKEKKETAAFKSKDKDKDTVDLSRQEAEVYRIVRSYIGGLKYIYNNELKTNPSLKGTVTVSITISSEGKVSGARVTKSTMNAPTFESAVIERILLWRFNKLTGVNEFTISYTFDFSPVG